MVTSRVVRNAVCVLCAMALLTVPGPHAQLILDCNDNGVPDSVDIAVGTSADCNGNEVPDECDTAVVLVDRLVVNLNTFGGVDAADLDADGDPDIVAAVSSGSDRRFSWFENTDGTGAFGPEQVIAHADSGVATVHAADIDGDGDLDLLAGRRDGVGWFENTDGAGAFGDERAIGSLVALQTIRVRAADLDGDGDPDALVGFPSDDRISWHENLDGLGNFGDARDVDPDADYVRSALTGDVDGDGDDDVVSASRDEVVWHENTDGLGSFAEHVINPSATSGGALPADLDGDGDLDILVPLDDDDWLVWYENTDGDGTFGPEQRIDRSFVASPLTWAGSADLDGDGDLDAMAHFESALHWYENADGLGSFGDRETVPGGGGSVLGGVGLDIDGDGDVDVLTAGNSISWRENESDDCNGNTSPDDCDVDDGTSTDCDGDGVPDECSPDCNDNGTPDPCDISTGASDDCNLNTIPDECEPDCNGNGVADVCDVTSGTSFDCNANNTPDECETDCNLNDTPDECDIATGASFDCNDNGVPDECEPFVDCNGNEIADICDVGTGSSIDCNGNGVPDECETDCDGNGVEDECDTALRFVERTIDVSANGRSVHVADFDGDGAPDLLVADQDVGIYTNSGSGEFSLDVLLGSSVSSDSRAHAADLDGDGDLDPVVLDHAGERVVWHANNVDFDGTYGPEQLISNFFRLPYDVATGDFDGDADQDVVVSDASSAVLNWFENLDGLGSFGPPIPLQNGEFGPREVEVADIDGDGDPDILTRNPGLAALVWYENTDGAATFVEREIAPSISGLYGLQAADLDGDEDLDVLVAESGWENVIWFENLDGLGTFDDLKLIDPGATATYEPNSVFAADVDGDGSMDVVAASWWERVNWWRNVDGSGLFASAGAFGDHTGLEPNLAFAGDLDADGDTDVLVGSLVPFPGPMRLYENESNDCNANRIPDACEADCDSDGVIDECDDVCPDCDTDSDGCPDCASGSFDPASDGIDLDGDGVCSAGDCLDTDETVWSVPSPVDGVTVVLGDDATQLSWSPPSSPGALAVVYDALRSPMPGNFHDPAICLESDTSATEAWDSGTPGPDDVFHYLIRVQNGCAAGETIGSDSGGVARTARSCP